jgi:hypothetical protein
VKCGELFSVHVSVTLGVEILQILDSW